MFLPSKRIKKKKKFWLNLLHKERTWILLSFVWPVLLFYTGCESHIAGGVAQCPRVNSSFVDLVSHFLTFRCAKLFTSPPQQKWEAARGGGEILSSSRSRPLKEKKSFGVTMCACTRWLYMRVYVYVRRRRRRRAEAYMAREKERAAAADPPSIESTRKKMRFSSSSPALVHVWDLWNDMYNVTCNSSLYTAQEERKSVVWNRREGRGGLERNKKKMDGLSNVYWKTLVGRGVSSELTSLSVVMEPQESWRKSSSLPLISSSSSFFFPSERFQQWRNEVEHLPFPPTKKEKIVRH